MGLSVKGYGIHGTNEPKSIGKASFAWMHPDGAEGSGRDVRDGHVGDTVELIGQRNEETAQLFGEQKPMTGRAAGSGGERGDDDG